MIISDFQRDTHVHIELKISTTEIVH